MYPGIGVSYLLVYEGPCGKSEKEAARIVDQFIAEELSRHIREAKRRFAEKRAANGGRDE